MAIVFVHGVNNRQGPGYRAGQLLTEQFLKKHLAGATITGKTLSADPRVYFPYWGDLATTFAWGGASLPKGDFEALGTGTDEAMKMIVAVVQDAAGKQDGDNPLLTLARKDFQVAVDAVAALALDAEKEDDDEEDVADLVRFVFAVQSYATAHPAPAWLTEVDSDSAFLGRLSKEASDATAHEALGGGLFGKMTNKLSAGASKLKQAASKVVDSALDRGGDFASTKLLAYSREPLNEVLGRFFGDVFVYMDSRGHAGAPGPIPQRILADFDNAIAESPGEPLVIVGHSLGGVITFDLLSHFRPDIEVALFASIGSQVAHFEEVKLYRSSDKSVGPPNKAKKPANIKRWINVFDEVDIFSYACRDVFEGVDIDAAYDTKTFVVKAHSEYFKQDRFYQRLRARIGELTP